MGNYVIASVKSWNIRNAGKLAERYPDDRFTVITDREGLTEERLKTVMPEFVFFPHWPWMIPESICSGFRCVVFHMTDLPFGRGGSPLQNLLARGIYETKISAVKACREVDAGPVYFKVPFQIREGNADDMLQRASDIIFTEMIPRFLSGAPVPKEQEGEKEVFKRRTREQSEIPQGLSQRQIYDHIRMLDGEGYPAAYIRNGEGKIYFRNARLENDTVFADAEFGRDR